MYIEKAVTCIYLHMYMQIVIRDRAGQYCNFSAYHDITIYHRFYNLSQVLQMLRIDCSIRVF